MQQKYVMTPYNGVRWDSKDYPFPLSVFVQIASIFCIC